MEVKVIRTELARVESIEGFFSFLRVLGIVFITEIGIFFLITRGCSCKESIIFSFRDAIGEFEADLFVSWFIFVNWMRLDWSKRSICNFFVTLFMDPETDHILWICSSFIFICGFDLREITKITIQYWKFQLEFCNCGRKHYS